MSPPLLSFSSIALLAWLSSIAVSIAQSGNAIFSLRKQITTVNNYDAVNAAPDHFTAIGSLTVFAEGNNIYASDGTTAGTQLVFSGGAYAAPTGSTPTFNTVDPHFTALGSQLIFSTVGADGSSRQVWATNGTAAGNVLLHSTAVAPNPNPSAPTERVRETQPNNLVKVGSYVYWTEANLVGSVVSVDWWRTDGTVAGTLQLRHYEPAQPETSWPTLVGAQGKAVLMFTSPTGTHTVVTSDGTVPGTLDRGNLPAPSGAGSAIHALGTWSDDTLVYFYRRVTSPTVLSGEIYAFNPTSGAITQILSIPSTDRRAPEGFFVHEGATRFYFPALIDHGLEVETAGVFYTTDGTSTGTIITILSSTLSGLGNYFVNVQSVGTKLCFVGRDFEQGNPLMLYFGELSSDTFLTNTGYAVEEDTVPLLSTAPDGRVWVIQRQLTYPSASYLTGVNPSNPADIKYTPGDVLPETYGWVGNKLWMGAGLDFRKSEPWTMNAAGTSLAFVADLLPQSGLDSSNYKILETVVSSSRYFLLADFGDEKATLLLSNGRRGDVNLITDAWGRGLRGVYDVIAMTNGSVEFFWNQELWRSDGSTAGTVRLGNQKFIKRVGASSYHQRQTSGTYFFTDTPDATFPQLWKTPLAGGTPVALTALDEPPQILFPIGVVAAGGGAAFLMDSGNYWKPDSFTTLNPPIPPRSNKTLGYSQVPSCDPLDPACTDPVYTTYLGTHDGSQFIPIIAGADYTYLGVLGSNTYFVNSINKLFRTTGVAATTTDQGTVGFAASALQGPGVVVGSSLFFVVKTATGFALWKTAGAAASTVLVKSLTTTSTVVPQLFGTSAALYFSFAGPANATYPGSQLWQSDGTTAGTVQVTKPMNVANFTSASSERMYFVGNGDLQIMPIALDARASTGWAMAHGLTGTNTLPSADSDKDGKTNLQELLQGTAPNLGLPNADCPILMGNTIPSALVSIPALASRHGISVWLEMSDDLINWTRTPTTPLVVPTTLKDDDCMSFPFSTGRFYRFSALEP